MTSRDPMSSIPPDPAGGVEGAKAKLAGGGYLVEIEPVKDGALSFVWDNGAGNYIYLEVGPQDTVHLFYDVVGYPKWEGVTIAADPVLESELGRAFAALYGADGGWRSYEITAAGRAALANAAGDRS